jgi:hypothetical protein
MFSWSDRLEAGPHVFLLVGVMGLGGAWMSCLLFLLANGLFWKNPLFFFTSCLSSRGCGIGAIGFPGDAEPLGGSTLENDVGLE